MSFTLYVRVDDGSMISDVNVNELCHTSVTIYNYGYISTQISNSSFTLSVFSKMEEVAVHCPKAPPSSSGDLAGFMPARTANYTPRKKTQTLYVTVKLPHRGEQKTRAETLRKRKIRGGELLQGLIKREHRVPV